MYYIFYLFTQIYAWPLLETLFSEVLTRDEWLMLFDNVFTNHPSFLLMVVVAYAMSARGPLMQCVELDDFRVSEVQDWDTKNKNKKHFYKNSTDLQIFKISECCILHRNCFFLCDFYYNNLVCKSEHNFPHYFSYFSTFTTIAMQ